MFIILQIFFATRGISWKLGNITGIFPSFSLGIFSHVTCLDQSHASENKFPYSVCSWYLLMLFWDTAKPWADRDSNWSTFALDLDVFCSFTSPAHILCFCNSPSCPQAVCKSSQRCFTKLIRKASADGNVSTSVMYGCREALKSSDACLESSPMMCCNKELCNMPNMLRSKYS